MMKKLTFKRGGVHPPQMKLTSGSPITDIELPRRVVIGLSESIGKPAAETVTVGQHVDRGQLIGKAQGSISANLHTPISGTVKAIGDQRDIYGHWQRSVTIEASDDDHMADIMAISDARPIVNEAQALAMEPSSIKTAIEQAGIVGLGGATFPTAVKLNVKDGVNPIVIINGAECEPYLTCDEMTMREMGHEVIVGALLLAKAAGASRIIIGIEDNKPEAIKKINEASREFAAVEVAVLKAKYPQGGEKMLIEALTGRRVAPGALPISEGVVVQNVATALAVYHAVVWGLPLIERVMTISGSAMAKRGNYRVPLGTELGWLIDRLGGSPDQAVELVAGGTMMGRSLASVKGSTTKGLGGLLFLSREEVKLSEPTTCVKCGRCIEVCPMGLRPNVLARLSELDMIEEAAGEGIMNCLECGSCSYACIASRRLVDWIKVGKTKARNLKNKR